MGTSIILASFLHLFALVLAAFDPLFFCCFSPPSPLPPSSLLTPFRWDQEGRCSPSLIHPHPPVGQGWRIPLSQLNHLSPQVSRSSGPEALQCRRCVGRIPQ